MKLEIEGGSFQRTHKTTSWEKRKSIFSFFHISQSLCQLSIHCLRPECSLQYMLCDKQQNSFKLFFYKVRTVLSFLSAGCCRDTAGGRGCPAVFTKNQGWEVWVWGHLVEHWPNHGPRMQTSQAVTFHSPPNLQSPVSPHALNTSCLHMHWDSHYKPTTPAADLLPHCLHSRRLPTASQQLPTSSRLAQQKTPLLSSELTIPSPARRPEPLPSCSSLGNLPQSYGTL